MEEACDSVDLLQERLLTHVEGVLKVSEILREDICGAAPPDAECTKVQVGPISLAESLTWHLAAIGNAAERIDGNLIEIRNVLSPYQPPRTER